MEAASVRTKERLDDVSPLRLDSVVLSRILDEVRNDAVSAPTAYNRTHNRHNR